MRRTSILLPAGVLGSAVLSLAGCGNPEPGLRPNLVVISVDTLRADHLPTYGYGRVTAPHIDELARNGTVFDRCYAESSHTLLTHATLLTGLYPETHGMLSSRSVLSAEFPTLAETLRDQGYRTGAFVNCGYFHPKFQLDRGFDTYDYFHDQQQTDSGEHISFGRTAGQTNRKIFDWLDQADGEPFFLFAHYYDVHSDWKHSPYEAPPEYRERFEIARPPGFRMGDDQTSASLYLLRRNDRGMLYDESETAYLRSLYDAGIAYADAQIGALLGKLQEAQLLDRSIVILLSDHGEEFQEHGKLLHSQVYEELVRVPLVIVFPAGDRLARGRRVDSLVQLSDVMPSVLEYLDLDPQEILQGKSFLPLLAGDEPSRRYAYVRNHDGSQYGIRDARWKLVVHGIEERQTELFDLVADPGETVDVAAHQADKVQQLSSALATWLRETVALQRDPGEPAALDPQTLKQLEALGYVGD